MREFALFIIVTPQNTISGNNCVRQSIATFKKAVTTRTPLTIATQKDLCLTWVFFIMAGT